MNVNGLNLTLECKTKLSDSWDHRFLGSGVQSKVDSLGSKWTVLRHQSERSYEIKVDGPSSNFSIQITRG